MCSQLIQDSNYNNPESLDGDSTSTAQVFYVANLVSGYFINLTNMTIYLSVAIVLPISAFIFATVTICNYYGFIEKEVQNIRQRPVIVGAAITGLCSVIFIMILDSHYVAEWDEYSFNSTLHNLFQLNITRDTLLMEYTISILALLICIVFIAHKEWRSQVIVYHTSNHGVLLKIVWLPIFCLAMIYILGTTIEGNIGIILSSILFLTILFYFFLLSRGKSIYLISFMVIPVIFVSTHMGSIFIAWLTDPMETDSISVFVISIIFILYLMSPLVYKTVCSLMGKYIEDERILLLITFIIVFCGAFLTALNVSAATLAVIIDISVLVLSITLLVSYKLFEDKKAYNINLTQFQGTQIEQNLEARLHAKFVCGEVRIDPKLNGKCITSKIKDATIIVQLKGYNSRRSVKIEIEDVNLNLGFICSDTEQVRFPLSESKLSFKLVSSTSTKMVIVPLKNAFIGDNSLPASGYELHILRKESKPVVLLTTTALSCITERIKIGKTNQFIILKIPLKSHISKNKS